MQNHTELNKIEVILGNSNKRFSGVTSTMLQTFEQQIKSTPIRILGTHNLPEQYRKYAIGFWDCALHLRKPLANGQYRVFHARRNNEMIQALILKHLFRAKLRIIFTSTAQRYHSGFTRFLMSKMDCILSTCKAAAHYLQHSPKAIIPHGIDAELYSPDTHKPAPSKNLTLGIFGRVRPQKGTHLFVHACIELFSKHTDAKAIIVGAISPENQSFVNELKLTIQQHNFSDRIQFLGEQAFEDIPNLFKTTDIVAALSHTEGFGLTVLEAMSSGAAVIATDAGAWSEIIEQGKQGWVVKVNDQVAITEKLDSMLSNPERVRAMGEAGRERILKNYTIQREAQQLCEVYKIVAEKT